MVATISVCVAVLRFSPYYLLSSSFILHFPQKERKDIHTHHEKRGGKGATARLFMYFAFIPFWFLWFGPLLLPLLLFTGAKVKKRHLSNTCSF